MRFDKCIRVLVIAPELLAQAFHALLSTIDDVQVLSPVSDPDQVLPFISRVNSAGQTIDVIVLHWSGDLEGDLTLLEALNAVGQRCLIVTPLIYPNEIHYTRVGGAWGIFCTTAPVHHLTLALHRIAEGEYAFPEDIPLAQQKHQEAPPQRRLVAFHEERLRALAREILWDLTETEILIFRYFTNASIEEIAARIHLRPTTVRRELSERIYEFLKLISGQPVPNRFVALQVLYAYGILEYLLSP